MFILIYSYQKNKNNHLSTRFLSVVVYYYNIIIVLVLKKHFNTPTISITPVYICAYTGQTLKLSQTSQKTEKSSKILGWLYNI